VALAVSSPRTACVKEAGNAVARAELAAVITSGAAVLGFDTIGARDRNGRLRRAFGRTIRPRWALSRLSAWLWPMPERRRVGLSVTKSKMLPSGIRD